MTRDLDEKQLSAMIPLKRFGEPGRGGGCGRFSRIGEGVIYNRRGYFGERRNA